MPKRLTLPETIWLTRRRLGLTQVAFAARLGATVHEVYDWERGAKVPDHLAWPVVVPTPLEWAVVLRRRSGLGLKEVARRMGVSHVTLLKRERGEGRVSELMRWWRLPPL
jgi:DNA-binding transcriptional regulator YiaG